MLARVAALESKRADLRPSLAAVRADEEPERVPLHDVVLRLFERVEPIEAGVHRMLWRRLLGVLQALPRTAESALRAAVFANLVAVVALGEGEDYLATAALVRRAGSQRVARLQAELDALLRSGADLPVTTAAVRELARTTHIEHALRRAGRPGPEAVAVAEKCYNAAFWLLITDLDPRDAVAVPEHPDDLLLAVDKLGVPEWRRLLANIAVNPWGPEATRLHELALAADLPAPAQAIEWCAKVYRRRFEEAERLEVAKEIRRLVAISGCSQRQFAQYIGTSPSRLSTYVNGLVTPSAAMMLRISRAAGVLAQGAGSGGVQT